jgi:hypothetical protein
MHYNPISGPQCSDLFRILLRKPIAIPVEHELQPEHAHQQPQPELKPGWLNATDTDIISAQHFWTGGLETAGRLLRGRDRSGGGFPNADYEPHPSCGDCPLTARSQPKRAAKNIPKNRCRTTIAERGWWKPERNCPLSGIRSVCLSHDQAARRSPNQRAAGRTWMDADRLTSRIGNTLPWQSGP